MAQCKYATDTRQLSIGSQLFEGISIVIPALFANYQLTAGYLVTYMIYFLAH